MRLPTSAGASGRGLLWQGVNALGKGFSISWFCRMVPALTSSVGPGSELSAPVGFSCQLRLSSFPMNHRKIKNKILPVPPVGGVLRQGVNALGKGFSISWYCRTVPALTSSVEPGSELPAPVGFSCRLWLCSFPMNHR